MKRKKGDQQTETKNLFCYLDAQDHVAFKTAAAKCGTPMSVILRQLVKDWLAKPPRQSNAA